LKPSRCFIFTSAGLDQLRQRSKLALALALAADGESTEKWKIHPNVAVSRAWNINSIERFPELVDASIIPGRKWLDFPGFGENDHR
jgi:hypothetical protein